MQVVRFESIEFEINNEHEIERNNGEGKENELIRVNNKKFCCYRIKNFVSENWKI
jgi:hypothetical protein